MTTSGAHSDKDSSERDAWCWRHWPRVMSMLKLVQYQRKRTRRQDPGAQRKGTTGRERTGEPGVPGPQVYYDRRGQTRERRDRTPIESVVSVTKPAATSLLGRRRFLLRATALLWSDALALSQSPPDPHSSSLAPLSSSRRRRPRSIHRRLLAARFALAGQAQALTTQARRSKRRSMFLRRRCTVREI
jgi:hypothetical protein